MDIDLRVAVSNLEKLLESCERLHTADNNVARALCALYAMKCARVVLTCIAGKIEVDVDAARNFAKPESMFGSRILFPDPRVIHSASEALTEAVDSGDRSGTLRALEQMGIVDLCPKPEDQLSRLELMVSGLTRQAQLVLLVELAILAVELGDNKRAKRYVSEARAFGPGASELHDLISIDGVIALSEGDHDRAVGCLTESIRVCLADEYACLSCSVRAPNFMLVDKLLEQGGQESVLKFLIDCQDVWERHRKGFAKLIDAMQNGELELRASGLLGTKSHPSVRVLDLYARACLDDDQPRTTAPKSRADVIAGRERLRAEYKGLMSAAIKGKLGSNNN